jgi:hypothetical protein
MSFRQISQRLNVPSRRQHFIARSEARFNNCTTQTTRAAGDQPYLRHLSSCIEANHSDILEKLLKLRIGCAMGIRKD